MNDRFKFRVWDNDKRKYDENKLDYFICCYEGVVYESHASVFDDLTESKKGHYTLEQCTGLKDKNGRLIYEGDIVAKEFSNKPFSSKAKYKIKNCLVYWQESGQFSIEYNSDEYRYYSAFHDSFIGECEVIGNIHENPELLEE